MHLKQHSNWRIFLMHKAMLFLAVFGLVGSLWAAAPFIGTWKVNIAESSPIPLLKSGIVKIEPQDNGLRVVFDRVGADGKVTHTEYAAKYDGKDHPVTGDPNVDMVALTRIDANAVEAVWNKGGREVGRNRGIVSRDGKTMTVITRGNNEQRQEVTNTLVLNKQ
jgi:hypothetical protein